MAESENEPIPEPKPEPEPEPEPDAEEEPDQEMPEVTHAGENTVIEVEGQVCPRPGCDAPCYATAAGTDPFVLTTPNMIQAKACVVPTDIGDDPGFRVGFHSYMGLSDVDGSETPTADVVDEHAPDPMLADGIDTVDDLPDDHRTVYEIAHTGTAENGHIKTKELRPECWDHDIDTDRMESCLLDLQGMGFVEEIEDAVYVVPGARE